MCKDRAIIFILFTLMIDAIGVGIVFPIMPDLMERVGANDTGQGALLPFLISFTGEYKTILLGMGAAVVGMIRFSFTTTITAMVIFLVTAALSDLLPPLLTAITSNATDDERQGVVQGVIAALSSLAAVISPVLMTGLFHMSVDSKGVYFPGAPFIFSSFLILLMIPLVRRIRPR